MIAWKFYRGGMWIRIFGRGLSVVNRKVNPLVPFSVRTGKTVWLGRWTVTLL